MSLFLAVEERVWHPLYDTVDIRNATHRPLFQNPYGMTPPGYTRQRTKLDTNMVCSGFVLGKFLVTGIRIDYTPGTPQILPSSFRDEREDEAQKAFDHERVMASGLVSLYVGNKCFADSFPFDWSRSQDQRVAACRADITPIFLERMQHFEVRIEDPTMAFQSLHADGRLTVILNAFEYREVL